MSAHTHSMIPSLVILFAVFAAQFLLPFLPTECQMSYVIFLPGTEKLYFHQPPQGSWNQPKQHQRSTRKSHRVDDQTSLVEDSRVRVQRTSPAGSRI